MKNKLLSFPSKLIILNIILIVIQLVIILIQLDSLPAKIPLFLNRPWGEEQLGDKIYIFLIPSISFLSFLAGIVLHKYLLKNKDDLLTATAFLFSILFSLLSIISILRITALVN